MQQLSEERPIRKPAVGRNAGVPRGCSDRPARDAKHMTVVMLGPAAIAHAERRGLPPERRVCCRRQRIAPRDDPHASLLLHGSVPATTPVWKKPMPTAPALAHGGRPTEGAMVVAAAKARLPARDMEPAFSRVQESPSIQTPARHDHHVTVRIHRFVKARRTSCSPSAATSTRGETVALTRPCATRCWPQQRDGRWLRCVCSRWPTGLWRSPANRRRRDRD